MNQSPLLLGPLFRIGSLSISAPVVTTWTLMAAMILFILLLRSRRAHHHSLDLA